MTKDWDWMEASSEEKNRVTLKFFSGIFLFLIIFPLHLSHLQITAKAPTARNAWNMKFKREPFLGNSRIFVKASLQSFLHSLLFQIEPTNPIDFIQTYFSTDLRLHMSNYKKIHHALYQYLFLILRHLGPIIIFGSLYQMFCWNPPLGPRTMSFLRII